MFKALQISAVLLVSSVAMSQAATVVSVLTSDGIAQETVNGIRSTTTTFGSDLGGMNLTATYGDGSSEVLTWVAENPVYSVNGGVSGSGISISAGWDGFELSTTRLLTGLSMSAGAAGSLFDISFAQGTAGDTPTSLIGFPLSFVENTVLDGTVTAEYSGIVNMAGDVARGDLYTDMSIDFSQVSVGGLLGSVRFYTDLDTLADFSDLSPVDISAVPLPATLPLMLVGLGGIGLMRRKKRS
jgi:hypothetical protein